MSTIAESVLNMIPYCTIDEDFEVTNTRGPHKIVHYEKPDEVYCFKIAEIDLDKMLVIKREGFSDSEIAWILEFTKANRNLIERNN